MTDLKAGNQSWRRSERQRRYAAGLIPPRMDRPEDKIRRRDYLPYLNEMSYQDYIFTPHWGKVRKARLEDAKGICGRCEAYSLILEVVHLNYKNVGREGPGDVICLCPACANEGRNREREKEQAIWSGIRASEDDALRPVHADGSLADDTPSGSEAGEASLSGLQQAGESIGESGSSSP